MATRKEQRITIQNPNRLSDQEVERMKREAKEFEEQDRKKREEAELMNEADQFIYNSEKLLADAGDKLSDEDKNSLASKINYLRDSLKARDVAKVKSSLDELKDELSRISTKIYGASYQGQGEGFQPGGPSGA
jgi:molecular chaperone DnaK